MRAPAAARNFQPGQFYRLQNFEAIAPRVGGAPLLIEPLRADRRLGRPGEGAPLDDRARDRRLDAAVRRLLKPGEPVVVMGPTGTADGASRETRPSCSCGGGLGNAVLFSIGKKARASAATGSSTSPATRRPRTSTSARSIESGGRRRHLVGRPRRGDSGRAGRRTGASSATSSRRWSPTRRQARRVADRPLATSSGSSPSAPTG